MRAATMLCVTAAAFLLAGCGDSRDKVMNDTIGVMEEMVGVMATVKDEASAKAVETKIKALGERMNAIKKRADGFGKPTDAEEKALKEKYEPRMKAVMEKMFPEMMRIMLDPKLGPLLKDSLKDMKSGG